MRILLIDDNHDLVDVLQMILESENHQADCAYDYDTAMNQINKNQYDILFIDAKLPHHNGFDIFQSYRELGGKARVVIMTAFRCEQLIDYLVSPQRINLIHNPDNLDIINPDGSSMVQIVISDNNQKLQKNVADNDSSHYTLMRNNEDLNKIGNNPSHIVISTTLTVMENILLIYQSHKINPHNHYTLLVDSKQYKHPLREFLSCGCLLKPFEPEEMIYILNLIRTSALEA